jgi:peptidoglycan/xylan/chitin deacetylase (PgdA/CDA1 family)
MFAAVLIAALHLPLVLMYHRVDVSSPGDPTSQALTVTPAQFDDEMALLAHDGFEAISIDQYALRVKLHEPTDRVVLLTFDDGYSDQYRFAVPILARYGYSATFFVNTGSIGQRNHLSWQQLRDMQAGGMSIEAHGVHHVDLATLPVARQAFEIEQCIASLREHLGGPVVAFAYPSGAFDANTMRLVAGSGMEYAFTTDAARRLWDSPYDLARIRIKRGLDAARFAQLLGLPQAP